MGKRYGVVQFCHSYLTLSLETLIQKELVQIIDNFFFEMWFHSGVGKMRSDWKIYISIMYLVELIRDRIHFIRSDQVYILVTIEYTKNKIEIELYRKNRSDLNCFSRPFVLSITYIGKSFVATIM